MRRALLAALFLPLAACSSLDQFDIPLTAEGVLRGSLSMLGNSNPPLPSGADVSRKIANQGVKASDITTARLTAGSITVTDPPTGNLSYLDSFEIFVESPGLEKKRIAHQDAAFAERKAATAFILDDLDLKPYLAAASMTLSPTFKQHGKPLADETFQVALTLHVDLTIIK